MRKGVFAIALGLVCQGCFSREAPEIAAAVSVIEVKLLFFAPGELASYKIQSRSLACPAPRSLTS